MSENAATQQGADSEIDDFLKMIEDVTPAHLRQIAPFTNAGHELERAAKHIERLQQRNETLHKLYQRCEVELVELRGELAEARRERDEAKQQCAMWEANSYAADDANLRCIAAEEERDMLRKDALKAELALKEAERDALRYRWLRAHSWLDTDSLNSTPSLNFGPGANQQKPEMLDRAIDGSMDYPQETT